MSADEQDECKKERDSAYETLNSEQAEYDKQLLTLSSAFLGVSLAFVKDVVPLQDAIHLWEFDTALGLFLACVCLVLGTFQYSIHGHFRLIEYWELKEKSLQETDDALAKIEGELRKLWEWLFRKSVRIRFVNWTSGILFAAGVVLLVLFVITNVNRVAHLVPAMHK
jgi:hypothetical protein